MTDVIIKNLNKSLNTKIIVNYEDKKDSDIINSKHFSETNYICVDKFSNFVVSSNIRITVKRIFFIFSMRYY